MWHVFVEHYLLCFQNAVLQNVLIGQGYRRPLPYIQTLVLKITRLHVFRQFNGGGHCDNKLKIVNIVDRGLKLDHSIPNCCCESAVFLFFVFQNTCSETRHKEELTLLLQTFSVPDILGFLHFQEVLR